MDSFDLMLIGLKPDGELDVELAVKWARNAFEAGRASARKRRAEPKEPERRESMYSPEEQEALDRELEAAAILAGQENLVVHNIPGGRP